MSGLNEILDWLDDTIWYDLEIDDYNTEQDLFDKFNSNFTENNRLPLADILQEQMPSFMKSLRSSMFQDVRGYTRKNGTRVNGYSYKRKSFKKPKRYD